MIKVGQRCRFTTKRFHKNYDVIVEIVSMNEIIGSDKIGWKNGDMYNTDMLVSIGWYNLLHNQDKPQ